MSKRPSLLLALAAVLYLAAAVPLLFAPQEILGWAGAPVGRGEVALVQILGSALFGFAMLNWMQRHARVGGIFNRPIVVANLAHAGSASLLLARIATVRPYSPLLLGALALYALLAVAFATRLFVQPE